MRYIPLLLGTSLLAMSCGKNKFLTSSVPSDEIARMAYFEPISYIQHVEKGNKGVLNDSLSKVSQYKLDSLISVNRNKLKIGEKIVIDDDSIRSRIENETAFIIQTAIINKKVEGIALLPTIDSIMENNGERFAMATIISGFGRRKGNYGGQVAKGIGVGILTLGMYAPVPIKSNITVYTVIFDSKRNEIAFYNRNMPIEKSPTDAIIIEKQLLKLFKGYFYE